MTEFEVERIKQVFSVLKEQKINRRVLICVVATGIISGHGPKRNQKNENLS